MNPEVRIQEPESKRLTPAKSFEQLIVWQKAHQFVLGVYRFTENFPRSETYGLTSQFRRASVSILANTAQLQPQLEEVSKLLEAYSAKILASGF